MNDDYGWHGRDGGHIVRAEPLRSGRRKRVFDLVGQPHVIDRLCQEYTRYSRRRENLLTR
jgi:hypothetical protein